MATPEATVELLVFAKRPLPGHAKTRLARDLGPEAAAQLAASFIDDTISFGRDWESRSPGDRRLVLLGDSSDPTDLGVGPTVGEYRAQAAGSLGDRLRAGFLGSRDAGAVGGIALGSDTPHLPLRLLEDATRRVRAGDVVLGPALDGGYYLLGLPVGAGSGGLDEDELEELFGLAGWGGSEVLEETRRRLGKLGREWQELELFWDIDDRDDLVKWDEAVPATGSDSPSAQAVAGLLTPVPERPSLALYRRLVRI